MSSDSDTPQREMMPISGPLAAAPAGRPPIERWQFFVGAAESLLTIRDPGLLVRTLYDQLAPLLDLDVFFNYIANADDDDLTLAGSGGVEKDVADSLSHLSLGVAVCGTVARDRQPEVVANVGQRSDEMTELIRSMGIGVYACFPLVAGPHFIGTLSFGSRRRSSFDPDELELMRALADLVAVSIDRHASDRVREKLLAEASAARETAENLSSAKEEFIAVVSHELRLPMTTALGWADMLASDECDVPLHAKAAEEIARSVRAQRRLVDDLLDRSRLAAGKLSVHRTPMQLGDTILRAAENFRSAASKKGVDLQVIIAGRGPEILGDAQRIEQVVSNLLGNAMKFTPAGGRIDLELASVDGHARVMVRDTGIGIRKEMLPRIFEHFFQDDGPAIRRGLGLGLPIARNLVEQHGGCLTAQSDGEGLGSTFSFTLPLPCSAAS
jgi:signal transduction histidine kinase